MGYLRQMYGQRDKSFIEACLGGITLYAWWKDGEQYVGTTGTTLHQAKLEAVEDLAYDCDREELLKRVEEGL